jgi:hypothetical protein
LVVVWGAEVLSDGTELFGWEEMLVAYEELALTELGAP